ncbi:MAG: ribonuclease D [Leptospiraceae bacterium]|nr:ribonuclease D [Leptospiraceae bacterium]
MPDYQYITRQHQLDLAISQMSGAECLGVDTESSGYYTYFTELCLIQISAGRMHFVIDTLQNLDLSPLGRVMGNPDIIKIFHAAVSDVIELKRAYDWEVASVFDTLLACRMLGHKSCSLFNLVKHYEGVQLKKKEQKSNWKRRPLTESQLDYAHRDTIYLESLMRKMEAELEQLGLKSEYRAECDYMLEHVVVEPESNFNPDGWLKIAGNVQVSPIERGIIRELYTLRDQRARKDNMASFRLISNEGILRLARNRAGTMDELYQMRVGHPAFIKKEGKRILEVLADPPEIQESDLPRPPERDPQEEALLKRLKKWRDAVATHRGMDSALIASNRVLLNVVQNCPENIDALNRLGVMSGWKVQHYGPGLLAALHGKGEFELPPGLAVLTGNDTRPPDPEK